VLAPFARVLLEDSTQCRLIFPFDAFIQC